MDYLSHQNDIYITCLQQNNLRLFVLHTGHCKTDAGIDKGRVADGVLLATDLKVVAIDILKTYGSSQVTRVVYKRNLQTEQVADKDRVENGSIFAVAELVEECLVAKQRTLIAELLLIDLILKSCLDKVYQYVCCRSLALALNSLAQTRIDSIFGVLTQ